MEPADAGHNGKQNRIEEKKEERKGKQRPTNYTYNADRVIGNGSFGVVYEAHIAETGEKVAIKKVFQDKRYKNRELQIMKELKHPNIVTLKHAFYTTGDKNDEVFLNVVMDYFPENAYRLMKQYNKIKTPMPMVIIKLYGYQLFRYLTGKSKNSKGICHRDIKPQNLLVDPITHTMKLCDFGSAKRLVKGELNVSYICSRYYRAPELIFGATDYTTQIDVWSTGCVIAEFMLGQPLFPGDSGVDQLVEIIKVLGTPTKDQIMSMNPNYTEFKFPQIKAHPWQKVFRNKTPPEAIDLISKLLVYNPEDRLRPLEAIAHPFFDELRQKETRLPNEESLMPEIFDFTEGTNNNIQLIKEEKSQMTGELMSKLIPDWVRAQKTKK